MSLREPPGSLAVGRASGATPPNGESSVTLQGSLFPVEPQQRLHPVVNPQPSCRGRCSREDAPPPPGPAPRPRPFGRLFSTAVALSRGGGVGSFGCDLRPGGSQLLCDATGPARERRGARRRRPPSLPLATSSASPSGNDSCAGLAPPPATYHVRPAVARRPSPAAALPASPLAQPAALPGCRSA